MNDNIKKRIEGEKRLLEIYLNEGPHEEASKEDQRKYMISLFRIWIKKDKEELKEYLEHIEDSEIFIKEMQE